MLPLTTADDPPWSGGTGCARGGGSYPPARRGTIDPFAGTDSPAQVKLALGSAEQPVLGVTLAISCDATAPVKVSVMLTGEATGPLFDTVIL